MSDQCWLQLLWRPVANAEAAKTKGKQLSRPVPVSNVHTVRKERGESEVWADARL